MTIYKHPRHYEIAFSFINPKKQVDNFEKLIKKFSKIKVKKVLDIACGPSLQLRELSKRCYKGIALDLSSQMLNYLKQKAKKEKIEIETIKSDMTNFKVKNKVDFAFIMMGSLTVKSNKEFLSHLNSVSNSLNKGGLYLIQDYLLDWTNKKSSWTEKKDRIIIKTTFETILKNILNQTYTEILTLNIDDNGIKKKIINKKDFKFIFPQEFKLLIELNRKFEFLGWWKGNCNSWQLDKPLEKVKKIDDNIILLRKK